jgi:hypothetical protein
MVRPAESVFKSLNFLSNVVLKDELDDCLNGHAANNRTDSGSNLSKACTIVLEMKRKHWKKVFDSSLGLMLG